MPVSFKEGAEGTEVEVENAVDGAVDAAEEELILAKLDKLEIDSAKLVLVSAFSCCPARALSSSSLSASRTTNTGGGITTLGLVLNTHCGDRIRERVIVNGPSGVCGAGGGVSSGGEVGERGRERSFEGRGEEVGVRESVRDNGPGLPGLELELAPESIKFR